MAASAFSDPARAPRATAKPATFDFRRPRRSRASHSLARIAEFATSLVLLWSARAPGIASAQPAPSDFVTPELQTLTANDGTWSELYPEGLSPAGRVDHSTLYDPRRFRAIVFGGEDAESRLLNDVW